MTIVRYVLVMLLAVTVTTARGQAFTQWSVHAGMSRIIDDERNRWNVGYRIGGQGLLLANQNVGFGLMVSWERMASNVTGWGEMLTHANHLDIEGSNDIIDIHPIMRWESASPENTVNVFGQVGVGLHVRRAFVRSLSSGVLMDASEMRFASSVALGLALGYPDGLRVELFPAYTVTFPMSDAVDFYSLNAGVSLRF